MRLSGRSLHSIFMTFHSRNTLQVPFADMVNHSASCHTLLCHDPEAKVLEVKSVDL